MKTKQEILSILRERKPDWEKQYRIKGIALFGSFSRNDTNDQSDVDIIVEIDPSIGLEFVTLAESIENSLGMSVDVVSKNAIKTRYWETIEPELIYV